MKTFTVVSSDTQSKYTFETEATTVGELLAELDARNIDYANKSLYEGLTKSEFDTSNPDGILPHDVMYKGEPTSNLVFMLTAAKKKISSGADRAELYAMIKANGLAEKAKEVFGRSYTNVTTDELEKFVENSLHEGNEDVCNEECNISEFSMMALHNAFSTVAAAIHVGLIPYDSVPSILDTILGHNKDCVSKEKEVEQKYSDEEILALLAR